MISIGGRSANGLLVINVALALLPLGLHFLWGFTFSGALPPLGLYAACLVAGETG
jgi:hypothetical protein